MDTSRPSQQDPSLEELIQEANGDVINLSPDDIENIMNSNADTIYQIGKQYYDSGLYGKAIKWYQKAALINHLESQLELGQMYFYGQGTIVDFVKAYYWYTRQANDPRAQYLLGVFHELGESAMYFDKARRWFECSATAGNVEAQYKAGEINAFRLYDLNCRPRAIKYFQMAADNGHEKAKKAMEAMVLVLGEDKIERHQEGLSRVRAKLPKISVSNAYLKQLQSRVEAIRAQQEQTTFESTSHIPEKKNSQEEQAQEEEQNTDINMESEENSAGEEVEDSESYLAHFTEEERNEYLYLMEEKIRQEEIIKGLRSAIEGYDDVVFDLVDMQKSNELTRQKNQKMTNLFYELKATLSVEERFGDDNGHRPRKRRHV